MRMGKLVRTVVLVLSLFGAPLLRAEQHESSYQGPTGWTDVCEAAEHPKLRYYFHDDCQAAGEPPFEERLAGIGEPSLLHAPASRIEEAYRLIVGPTFQRSLIVRIWDPADTDPTLVYRKGWEPQSVERTLTESDRERLREQLRDSNFWYLPSVVVHLDDYGQLSFLPLHRTQWAIEGVRQGHYHVVKRDNPRQDDPLRELAEYLLRLAGLE